MEKSSKSIFVILLLITICLFVVVRLVAFSVQIANESLQMDFSAYYTAAEALRKDLSPYENHIDEKPPIWDGISVFKHSRFLYPPMVASLFLPFTNLSYKISKYIWISLSLFSLFVSLFLTTKIYHLNIILALISGIFSAIFYPLLTLLERGQIDCITLLLMTISFFLMLDSHKKQHKLFSGFLLAFATLLKLHCIFVVPFLFLRKKWLVIFGFFSGSILLLIVSVAFNGSSDFIYVTKELPRISLHGEGGTPAMLLSKGTMKKFYKDLPDGWTVKDGNLFQKEYFSFRTNASLVSIMKYIIHLYFGYNISQSSLSIFIFIFLFLFLWAIKYYSIGSLFLDKHEFIFWQIVLLIILLSGPLTWVMNEVWILPLSLIVCSEYLRLRSKKQAVYLFMAGLALIIAAMPDSLACEIVFPLKRIFYGCKYVFANLLLLVSMVLYTGSDLRIQAQDTAKNSI